jgi:tetratricopeptide (TPR) repeat protein
MEALAIFDRPVEETAIAYLLHPWFPDLHVPRALRRLATSYFVSTNRITGEHNLHPLDREYIYGRLPGGDEPNAYNKRNLELRAAAFYASIRKPEREWKAIDDLTPQLSEFEHLVRAKDYDGACQLLETIDHRYLYLWGHYTRLVEMRQRLVAHLKDPGMQIDNWGSLGRANRALGQFDRALARFRQAIGIARQIGDRKREGIQFGHLGGVYRALGQIEQSTGAYEQALAIAREIRDRRVECMHLGHVGMSYRARGEIDRGMEFHREALAIARDLDDKELQGANLASLGSGHRALGQIQQSVKFFEQSLAIAREIGDRRVEGFVLASLGRACRTLGQIEQAIEYHEQALSIARQTGYRQGEAADLGDLGDAYSGLGQTERAIEYHQQALAIARDIGDRRQQSWELIRLGRISLTMRHFSDAKDYLEEAVALDVTESAYMAALMLGILHLLWGDPERGRDTFIDVVRRCEDLLDRTIGLYRVRYTLATALVAAAVCNPQWENEGKRAELLASSVVEYRKALEICATTSIVQDALRDLELIRVGSTEGLESVFELLENALGTGFQASNGNTCDDRVR